MTNKTFLFQFCSTSRRLMWLNGTLWPVIRVFKGYTCWDTHFQHFWKVYDGSQIHVSGWAWVVLHFFTPPNLLEKPLLLLLHQPPFLSCIEDALHFTMSHSHVYGYVYGACSYSISLSVCIKATVALHCWCFNTCNEDASHLQYWDCKKEKNDIGRWLYLSHWCDG